MVSFKCKDMGMSCNFEATAANVQELDDKVAQHAKEVHKISPIDAGMWKKIHTAEH
jgi:predicted small metal-binding protein